MIRTVRALLRASWLTAMSYRLRSFLGLASLGVSVVPVFYVTTAMQPMMARSIANEGSQYFAFVLLGFSVMALIGTVAGSLPGAVQSGIGSGFYESLAMTRARPTAVLVGLSAYPILWALLRATLLLVGGWVLGARFEWRAVPLTLLVLVTLMAAHWGIGLIATALILAFRTSGPLLMLVTLSSTLLGGAYYSTSVIPPGVRWISVAVPATYGLRALRRVFLDGKSLSYVWGDLSILLGMTAFLLLVGFFSYRWALRYARRHGSLSHS